MVTGSASLNLTAPITAVSWRIANTQNITFSHNFGTGQRVAVDVSRDAGATWTSINPAFVTTSSTSGTVPWVVTGPITSTARARVTWSGNPAITSASPVNFTVLDRITVTAPNTAVTWTVGSTRSITWNHNLGTGTNVEHRPQPRRRRDLEPDRGQRRQFHRHHRHVQLGGDRARHDAGQDPCELGRRGERHERRQLHDPLTQALD